MTADLSRVISQFDTRDPYRSGAPYGSGHIHDTFAVDCGTRRYLLQRINRHIFGDLDHLMENIDRVTRHIRGKLEAEKCPDTDRRVLTPVRTREGSLLYRDGENEGWRVYLFIDGAVTYDLVRDLGHARAAAKAFGEFQRALGDLPAPPLHEIIPRFHDGPTRYAALERIVSSDPHSRAKDAKKEIEFVRRNAAIFGVVPKLAEAGALPVRITHNDTKINNVMIDEKSGEGICVIDLDTVMAGFSLYDFGDLVRSSGSGAAEDERDLSKIRLELPKFEALLTGYLAGAGSFLNETERKHLVHGAKLITLMIGTRFLTDFLDGDRYFRIHRPGHNLERCRTQYQLVQSLLEQADELDRLVERISSGS
ncbi:MAG: aminoglycoside phosphotransferase family protein [Pseudomonadota bacterium]